MYAVKIIGKYMYIHVQCQFNEDTCISQIGPIGTVSATYCACHSAELPWWHSTGLVVPGSNIIQASSIFPFQGHSHDIVDVLLHIIIHDVTFTYSY